MTDYTFPVLALEEVTQTFWKRLFLAIDVTGPN